MYFLDDDNFVTGLITLKDIKNRQNYPNAVYDNNGQLLVGAAVGVKGDYLERAAELIKAGADVLVVDVAHGHSEMCYKAVELLKACRDTDNVDIVGGQCGDSGRSTLPYTSWC